MSPVRPIGHIAGNLQILAISAAYRMRQAADGATYLCWIDDDGCVYLAISTHPRAIAAQRHAPEQRVCSYRKPKSKPFPLGAVDMLADLRAARTEHAMRHLQQAHHEATAA